MKQNFNPVANGVKDFVGYLTFYSLEVIKDLEFD